jgi:dihydropteroate synthase
MPDLITPEPIRIGSTVFDYSRTYVIGILNVTPDSFSDGGIFAQPDTAVSHALDMISHGADIIDIGGESTRPGADPLSYDREIERVIPVIERLRSETEAPISIDTYKSSVAEAAIDAGANIVNDISGLRFDPKMARTIADHDVPVIVMHIKGEPRSMQENPVYSDLIGEIKSYLADSIALATEAGISADSIIIDPGIGFGKTFDHNFKILNSIQQFADLGKPILTGASRKAFLGSLAGTEPEDRLPESLSAAVIAASNGAHFIRVHDVVPTVRALRVVDAVRHAK